MKKPFYTLLFSLLITTWSIGQDSIDKYSSIGESTNKSIDKVSIAETKGASSKDSWAVPFYEDFDDVVPPEMPLDWSSIVNSWSTYAKLETQNWGGMNGSYSLYMDNQDDIDAVLILITPQIEGGVAGKYTSFYSYGFAPLSVGTMSDPLDETTYTEYTSISLTNTFEEYEVLFTDYTGTDEYIAYRHGGTLLWKNMRLDNILVDEFNTCTKPSDLYLESSTLTSATIGWTENGSATTWNLEYGPKWFAPSGVPMITTDANPTELTGFESGTQYEFYVQADCGNDDLSYWVGPFEFATQCEAFNVPISETFMTATIPELPVCWSKIVESSAPYARVITLDNNSNSTPNSINMYNADDLNPDLILISPLLNDPVNQLRLNFFVKGTSSEISVGTISNPTDASTYTELATFDLELAYQEYEIVFDTYTGIDQYIAFKGVFEQDYKTIYVDDILIDNISTCLMPEDLYVTNQTTTSVTLGWTEMTSAEMWYIEYGDIGFTPSGIGNEVADSNPFELTGLEPGTNYEYYVQADCDVNGVSSWSGPLGFKTTCTPQSIPYSEGFEDIIAPSLPLCTIVENVNGDESTWFTTSENAYSESNAMRLNYNWGTVMDDWFYSAPLDLIGGESYIVHFFYTSSSDTDIERLEVKWGDLPTSSAMTSEQIFEDVLINYAYEYHEGIAYFTPTTDGVYYVGWHGYSWANQANLYVDHITIDIMPDCLQPTDLFANTVMPNSATLQWTENGEATTWNIEYGIEGFAPSGIPNITTDTNPFELTELDASTSYDIYIQSDCGINVSTWHGPLTIVTICEALEVPIFENFDTLQVPSLPLCWSEIVESYSVSAQVSTTDWLSHSLPNSVYLKNSIDASATVLFISPLIVESINTLWVDFFATGSLEGLEIGTITNPLDATTFNGIDTITLNYEDFEEHQIYLSAYTGTDQFIAFKAIFSGSYQDCFIDDITIDIAPTCPKPQEVYTKDATTNSVVLGWTEVGEATTWNVEYGYAGFIQTGNPNVEATSNPYELTGLEVGTKYDYYVQANCGGEDLSDWVGPVSFQTYCVPSSLPYTEGFEDVNIPLAPPCIVVENTNNDDSFWISSMMNPNNGYYHLSLGNNEYNPKDDWFFSAPFELLAGQSYNVVFYYASSSSFIQKLEVLWGDEPHSSAMINGPIFTDDNIGTNNIYLEGSTSFTPLTDGIYFIGWHAYGDSDVYSLYVDDIYIEMDNSLIVNATATPGELCEGENSQLNGLAEGGSGSYNYSWTSYPEGFTSTEQNPIVNPSETTDFILEVNDGIFSLFDTVSIIVTSLPGIPGTPIGLTYVCANWGNTTYSTSGATNTTSYNWLIDPEEAGAISGTSSTISVIWQEDFLGEASLSVMGFNENCEGEYSEELIITRYLPDVSLNSFDTVCVGWSLFELTGGSPVGGTYSGTGVTNGWFDPSVAGLGTHTIAYTYEDIALCENSAEQEIVVDVCTGIYSSKDLKINLLPNPNKGIFKISLQSKTQGDISIKIINSQGITIIELLEKNLSAEKLIEVNLMEYPKGLYHVYIHTTSGAYTRKLIIN